MEVRAVSGTNKVIELRKIHSSEYKPLNQKLKVSISEGTYLIDFKDIIRLQAFGNYSTIYLSNRKPIVASKPLKYFQDQLPADLFIRIHSSHLISINQLYFINKSEVVLKDESICPVSRSNKHVLKKLLDTMS